MCRTFQGKVKCPLGTLNVYFSLDQSGGGLRYHCYYAIMWLKYIITTSPGSSYGTLQNNMPVPCMSE